MMMMYFIVSFNHREKPFDVPISDVSHDFSVVFQITVVVYYDPVLVTVSLILFGFCWSFLYS